MPDQGTALHANGDLTAARDAVEVREQFGNRLVALLRLLLQGLQCDVHEHAEAVAARRHLQRRDGRLEHENDLFVQRSHKSVDI